MNINNKQKLLTEFPPVSPEEWKEVAAKDLSGKPLERINWTPYENITLGPFYTEEDLTGLENAASTLPGEFPFIRGNRQPTNTWLINEMIEAADINKANARALDSLNRGVEAITFKCEIANGSISGVPIQNSGDMAALLEDIPIKYVPIHFKCAVGSSAILALYFNEAQKRGIDINELGGSVDSDPIKLLALSGSLNDIEENVYQKLASELQYVSNNTQRYKALTVHGDHLHNSGASITQELAFTLATGVEYLDKLTSLDLSVDQISAHMSFSFSIGSNYFLEIAKLRAARYLWARIVDQYNANKDSATEMDIHVSSSRWNKTTYDPYNNLLRGTIETMAAAIGGCTSITVSPYDSTFKDPNDASLRIAGNTQLILKSESYLDQVKDASGGSYYIENLTDSIARESWKLFQKVEAMGGITQALKQGYVQKEIQNTKQKRDINIATGKDTILGVNQYPNLEETAASEFSGSARTTFKTSGAHVAAEKLTIESLIEYLDKENSFIGDVVNFSHNVGEFNVDTLTPYRGAEPFEKMRMATEKHGNKTGGVPRVFLIPFGNMAMRNARASFAANFFGYGGFEIISNQGFDSPEQAAKQTLKSNADIAVLCSSDSEYMNFAPEICGLIKDGNPDIKIAIAGNPKEHIDELRGLGIDEFIHMRSNALEILKNYQKELGITE